MPDPSYAGRLVLLLGPGADAGLARAVAARLGRVVCVDAAALTDLVATSRPVGPLLRHEAALLVGGLYAGAGYDALVTDDVADEDVAAVVNRAHELADAVHVVRLPAVGGDADGVAAGVVAGLSGRTAGSD